MNQLTEDQLGLIATAIRYGPFLARPEYLADGHRLFERGWLDRELIADQVVWSLSTAGHTALGEVGRPAVLRGRGQSLPGTLSRCFDLVNRS